MTALTESVPFCVPSTTRNAAENFAGSTLEKPGLPPKPVIPSRFNLTGGSDSSWAAASTGRATAARQTIHVNRQVGMDFMEATEPVGKDYRTPKRKRITRQPRTWMPRFAKSLQGKQLIVRTGLARGQLGPRRASNLRGLRRPG